MEGNKVALCYVCYVNMLISKLQCLILIKVSRGVTLRYKCEKIWQLYSTKEFGRYHLGKYFCSLFSLLKLDKNISALIRQNFLPPKVFIIWILYCMVFWGQWCLYLTTCNMNKIHNATSWSCWQVHTNCHALAICIS